MLNPASFGNYRLLAKINSGSLGEVYRARLANAPESPEVALKRLLPARVGNPDFGSVFAREIDISKQMNHHRLLGATDSGDENGWPYLVTRLAHGGTLRELLDQKSSLSGEQLSKIAADLGEALAAMHAFGFSHGDLNPSNVVFDGGRVHLIDFSAATKIGESQPRPAGSYAYMSPEQVRGEALDARSDVFVSAALLWECVSGIKAFGRDAQHLCFMAVVEADPPAMPEELAEVELVLRSALSKNPADRPDSASLWCSAFQRAIGNATKLPTKLSQAP